ncbi:MAG TPA: hypothetical protein PLB97_02215 [Accumulibacter sp.]|jgi:hypothetical protein|nr:hypothetical protein [Accumulibacter sp.]
MHLTVVVPELIWPEPGDRTTLDALVCPALSALLSRSRLQRRPPQSFEATLGDACGLPAELAYAPLRVLGEKNIVAAPAATWLCADPVHLRLHQEQLILADGSRLAITPDEAQACIDELNRQFVDSGCFHLGATERWYLQLPAERSLGDFTVLPLSVVAGRRVEQQLPAGADLRWLRSLLNEMQMVLHEHPVNQRREERGQPTINSLWLWGGGQLPNPQTSEIRRLWSDLPLARGLARHLDIPCQPLPAHADALLAKAIPDDQALLVLDALQAPVQYEDADAYRHALHDLEGRWFAPLRQALLTRRLRSLRLDAPTAYAHLRWQSRPQEQWRFWRRSSSLASIAQSLAQSRT